MGTARRVGSFRAGSWRPGAWRGESSAPGTLEIYDGIINIRPLGRKNLAQGSDNAIELIGLRGELSGQYPANATVTFSIHDLAGAPITGATNIAMPHVEGTTGARTTYRGELHASVSARLTTLLAYVLTIHVVDANQNVRVFAVTCAVLPG